MSTYVISDIHGQYNMFIELLDKIDLKDTDTLYILGDVLDRGPHPIKTIRKLMEMPNAICLVGNHELSGIFDERNLNRREEFKMKGKIAALRPVNVGSVTSICVRIA